MDVLPSPQNAWEASRAAITTSIATTTFQYGSSINDKRAPTEMDTHSFFSGEVPRATGPEAR